MGTVKLLQTCRLCSSSNDSFVHIFDYGYEVGDIIKEMLRFEVSPEDRYPQYVCGRCLGKLRDFKKFKEQCEACKESFDRSYAARSKSLPDTEPNEVECYVSPLCFMTEDSSQVPNEEEAILCQEEEEIDPLGDMADIKPSVSEVSVLISGVTGEPHEEVSNHEVECYVNPLCFMTEDGSQVPNEEEGVLCREEEEIDPLSDLSELKPSVLELNDRLSGVGDDRDDEESNYEHPMDFVDEMKPLIAETIESTSVCGRTEDEECEDFTLILEESDDEDRDDSSEASSNTKDVQWLGQGPSGSPPMEVEWQKILLLTGKETEKFMDSDVELVVDDDNTMDGAQGVSDDIDTLTDDNAERQESRAVTSALVPERRSRRISKKSDQATSNFEDSKERSGDASCSTLPRQKARGGTLASNSSKRRLKRLEDCGTSKDVLDSFEKEVGEEEERKVLDTHKFGKSFKCAHCDKYFAHRKSLSAHVKRHFEEELNCGICGKTFKYKTLMKSHLQRVHGDRNLKCDICGREFSSIGVLNEHKKVHIKGDNRVCSICGKTFENSIYFKKHMYNHKLHVNRQDKYACGVCGQKCISPSQLAIHMRIHTKERPFPCPTCGACLSAKYKLERHIKSMHTECGLNRVHCDQCGRSYSRIESLKRHKKANHMGLKEFKCKCCGQEFSQKHNLLTHVRKNHS